MARQDLAVTNGTSKYPTAGVAVTMTAENVTDHSRFVLTGREIVVIQNTDVGAQTYTVFSTADPQGRTGDITTQAIAAGAIHLLGPLDLLGWAQTVGQYLHLNASNAGVKFGVYRMPS